MDDAHVEDAGQVRAQHSLPTQTITGFAKREIAGTGYRHNLGALVGQPGIAEGRSFQETSPTADGGGVCEF